MRTEAGGGLINFIIRWSLANRWPVFALAAVLTGGGLFVARQMPVDVFPDLTAPTVTVIAEGHGLSPLEMETQVTFPIETAMNGAADVRRVRSGTAVGITVVWVEFAWGTDIFRARQTVAERLAALSGGLTEQVEPPKIAPISSIMGEILFLSLTSAQHDALELRTVATTQIRRRLLSIAGVSQVTSIGGDTRQYQVVLAPERLAAYELTAGAVAQALSGTNENVAGGVLIAGTQELIVEGLGRVRTTADIGATVVALRNDVPVTVADLGVVQIGAALKRGTASAARRGPQGEAIIESGVVIAVQKQPGANTLELTSRLDLALTEIQRGLPAGMHINKDLFRQATFIANSVENATGALLEGALMVLLVVILFLGSARASLITLCALPLSLCVAVLTLKALGDGINTMTLGGMAIAIGALVDDAIIDVENVVRRLRENAHLPEPLRRSALAVVYEASVEVRPSIVTATLVILLVFLPLFALTGIEGRLLQPLGTAFCVSLAASLLTALTLTPALCLALLPKSGTVLTAHEPRFVAWLKRRYARPLDGALSRPWLVALPSVALLVASLVLVFSMGRGFLPEFNEGALVVGVVTLPGTSLAESDRLAGLVEQALMRHPEIAAIGRRTGRAEEDEHVQGVEASEIDLTLDMEAPQRLGLPRRSKAELLEALRADLAGIPGIQATFGQPISHRIDHMLSGTRASVAVKIFGDDLATLRDIGRRVEERMRAVPGVVDLSLEQQALVPTLRVVFDRPALARHGLLVADAARALELASSGYVAGQVLEGVNAYDLLVRVGQPGVATPAALAATLVDTPSGARIPLGALASVTEDRSPNFVSRENAQRKIVAMCNVAGRDVASVVADIQAGLATDVALPAGYFVEFGGQFESAAATAQRLAMLGGLIVVGIVGLLFLLFRSVRDTLLIMLNLPLALIGGVAGVWATGGVLSVASIIGFITVFGIAVRNGVMLVSHVRHLQRSEGVASLREAVRRGALERLAPILMTALAAGLALVPLALRGEEPGNEILTPMAVVILFGLLSSTFLSLLVVPALFLRFGRSAAPLLAILACLGLTGCAVETLAPNYEPARELIRTTTGQDEVFDPQVPPLSAEELRAVLHDGLSMDEALRLALLNNRALQAGFMELGVARAQFVQAGLLQNPVLGLSLFLPSGGGRTRLAGDLAQNLSDLWRIPAARLAAGAESDLQLFALSRQAGELVAAVRRAYAECVAAREAHALAIDGALIAGRVQGAAQARSEAGVATDLETNLARTLAIEANLQAQRAERGEVETTRRLAALLSLQDDLLGTSFTDALPAVVSAPLGERERAVQREALVERARTSRLDLRAAAAAVVAAEARLTLERKRAAPDLVTGLGAERPEGGSSSDLLAGPALSVELPFFDRNEAGISRAEFEREVARLNHEALLAEVGQAVRAAYDRVQILADAAEIASEQLLPQAERSSALAQEAYGAGATTLLTLLEGQRASLDARRASNESRLDVALALLELELALGAPLDP
ncbi:MAG: CusA/CzcA family heavy metal efflux RND transporter [Planctomycetota bacterium]